MVDLRLDDYLRDGVLAAIDEVAALTGADSVNLVSVCIGATLAAIALGVLAARGEDAQGRLGEPERRPGRLQRPGRGGRFHGRRRDRTHDARTEKRGFFSGDGDRRPVQPDAHDRVLLELRRRELVHGPPAGAVRHPRVERGPDCACPARMHADFLRACYLENRLATPGEFEIDGIALDLDARTDAAVRARRRDRPHRAVALRLPDDAAHVRRASLRARGRWAHRGHGQPAGEPEGALLRQRRVPAGRGRLARRRALASTAAGGTTGSAGQRRARATRIAPPPLPDGDPAPGTFVHG